MAAGSWLETANGDTDFPIQNLPYGVFDDGRGARMGVAIGDSILDVGKAEHGLDPSLFDQPEWNSVMAAGPFGLERVAQPPERLAVRPEAENGRRAAFGSAGRRADADAVPRLRIYGLLRRQAPRDECRSHVPRAGKRAAAELAVDAHRL